MFPAPAPSATVRVNVCAEPEPEAGIAEATQGFCWTTWLTWFAMAACD